jgi:hypothetical protein
MKSEAEITRAVDEIHKEIQPALYQNNPDPIEAYGETENELNTKILKITMTIKDKYPELSKYIEEMPVTVPDEKHPEITTKNLKAYYDSLNSVLSSYIAEHPIQAGL